MSKIDQQTHPVLDEVEMLKKAVPLGQDFEKVVRTFFPPGAPEIDDLAKKT